MTMAEYYWSQENVAPFQVSENTLHMMDQSMENFNAGVTHAKTNTSDLINDSQKRSRYCGLIHVKIQHIVATASPDAAARGGFFHEAKEEAQAVQ